MQRIFAKCFEPYCSQYFYVGFAAMISQAKATGSEKPIHSENTCWFSTIIFFLFYLFIFLLHFEFSNNLTKSMNGKTKSLPLSLELSFIYHQLPILLLTSPKEEKKHTSRDMVAISQWQNFKPVLLPKTTRKQCLQSSKIIRLLQF